LGRGSLSDRAERRKTHDFVEISNFDKTFSQIKYFKVSRLHICGIVKSRRVSVVSEIITIVKIYFITQNAEKNNIEKWLFEIFMLST